MKPAARLQTVIDILEKSVTSRVPLDTTIGDYMRSRRFIGAKDRAAIVERVYGVTRMHARIGWRLERAGCADTPRTRMLAWLATHENASDESIIALFDGTKFAPAVLTEAEITALAAIRAVAGEMPKAVRLECPPQYETSLREYFGTDFAVEMEALQQPATLDLRVNTFLAAREKAHEALAKDSVTTTPTPYAEAGLRVGGKAFVSKTKAFVKGWIAIQDEGSQLIAQICGAKPGMQVLDYCAGGGGKTLALGAAMQRKGRIVAMDTEPARLAKARQRLRQAQLADIVEIRPLSDEKQRKWLRRQKEKFDIVLADVPCTGTGTWRRNPDLRWRTHGPDLETLVKTQAEILERTRPLVKPGGRLIYATCSLLPEENERQIEAFLAQNKGFSVLPPEDARLGAPYMRLTPYRHQTDGFFAAVLVKKIQ